MILEIWVVYKVGPKNYKNAIEEMILPPPQFNGLIMILEST
jgi:hypothetical protein